MPKIVDIEQNKRLRKLLPEWLRLVEHSYSWIARKLNVSNSLSPSRKNGHENSGKSGMNL